METIGRSSTSNLDEDSTEFPPQLFAVFVVLFALVSAVTSQYVAYGGYPAYGYGYGYPYAHAYYGGYPYYSSYLLKK